MSVGMISHNGSDSGREFVRRFHEIEREAVRAEIEWVDRMKANGVAAAHPDDGWVDRGRNIVRLVYPQFQRKITVGSIIALGHADSYRLVRVTEVLPLGFLSQVPGYAFEHP